ncbi:NUDIX domain-containing protein [Vibrio sp. Of7-15]|uniref:NUDIX hydrolase n=1 Tax=Vibrio sp. Of7-15 TaxID=2724879 RepID=UPI001EF3D411|nr:NUDIX domain-containing protein [Vibrio sp. Of7-15]MCG7500197.1 NUDIX domain-containing protein [Vibrio sp. Of7-15]
MSENNHNFEQRRLRREIKVCPVVIRSQSNKTEILLFRHPLAGVQLVKGTLELNETTISAALRELHEESGVNNVHSVDALGEWESGYQTQQWHFFVCHTGSLPERWSHYTNDDGGHTFEFFWCALDEVYSLPMHTVFQLAIKELQRRLANEI